MPKQPKGMELAELLRHSKELQRQSEELNARAANLQERIEKLIRYNGWERRRTPREPKKKE